VLKEFSYGAIIYKINNSNPEFLLVKSKRSKRWGFPKGHVEKGESELETARREIFEETGIKNLKFIDNFRQEDVYIIDGAISSTKGNMVEKHSIYFLAVALEESSNFDENEISEMEWADVTHAEKLLYFSKQKEVLKLAYKLIIGG
jgi:8-oxo-dGTP pyrophosphatase MutT (NUDIX family)